MWLLTLPFFNRRGLGLEPNRLSIMPFGSVKHAAYDIVVSIAPACDCHFVFLVQVDLYFTKKIAFWHYDTE
jgi:hypothetical protein